MTGDSSWDSFSRDELAGIADAYEKELLFLRFFYDAAGYAFGPAEDDVYWSIKNGYKAEHGSLPEGY